MNALVIVFLLLVSGISMAGEIPKNHISQDDDDIFPHIVFGGTEWKTTFFFFNPTGETERFPVEFYAHDGSALPVPCLGGMYPSVNVTLPPMGSISFETDDAPELAAASGWAAFDPEDANVQGLAIFRQRVPGRNDVEASVPTGNLSHPKQYLVFDNTEGFIMGVALANPSPQGTLMIEARFYDGNGTLFHTESFQMASKTHTAFTLPGRFPETAGKKGSVVFEATTTSAGPAVLGLRFSPNGSFTSVHPWGWPEY